MAASPDLPKKIAVVGLGYVGLPLAVALARDFDVVGFDKDSGRVAELKAGHDRTGEVDTDALATVAGRFDLSDDDSIMAGADMFIITVPTPIDDKRTPDLGPVDSAGRTIATHLNKGAIVVLESTVYPGVTEERLGAQLASLSGLKAGQDFFLGYSPERINPGDKEHTIRTVTKVVAGDSPETTAILADVYGRVTNGNVHVATTIKTAEAAKVIENAQRDINIAFINEITMIFGHMGISVHDVLDAAGSKWNFLPFTPGLVGGHCIGIDPYYLAHRAQEIGYDPEIILSGRRINDGMGAYFADSIDRHLPTGAKVLVLGLTFKENVPDLRNSRVIDVVRGLAAHGHQVDVHDPHADKSEAESLYQVRLQDDLQDIGPYDAIVGAVPHTEYRKLEDADFSRLLTAQGLVADIKAIWRGRTLPKGLARWSL